MKHLITLTAALLISVASFGQNYPLVTFEQIQTPVDLAACNDTSVMLGDTVRVRAHVVTDGGLSEVASGSVQGGNRPFVFFIDTAANGVTDSLNSMEVMGIYFDSNQNALLPVPGFTGLFQGDKVELTGVVEQFSGNTQFTTLDANSVQLLQSADLAASAFVPQVVPVSDLNDNQRVNQVSTGEYWENSYCELQNVTVVSVNPFSGNRVSFDVEDANGNRINVSDRFLAQKLPSFQLTNPNTPASGTTGSFVAPTVGTVYSSIRGMVRHSANGCTGGSGRGYEINPFDTSHYQVAASAPVITNVLSLPLTPTSNDSVTISANATDNDGTITSVDIYWSADPSVPTSMFSSFPMVDLGNGQYEYQIPNQTDGTLVRYYIEATDNDGSSTLAPVSGAGVTNPNFNHYVVRNDGQRIFDLQFSGDGNGGSAFEGQTVTVRGFVTAARQGCDLEYVYLQDPRDSLYSGIALIPNQDLNGVFRDQELEVTGTVQETFGVTYLSVSNVVGLPNTQSIAPTVVDINDPNLDLEAYEGMLISYQDPSGGQIEVSTADIGFGEYGLTSIGGSEERRVLAGRQDGTRANSSLYVSLVADTAYNTQNGNMMVPPVATQQGMTMDAMNGILWYSFGTFKIVPRNNFDIVNLSVSLDTAGCSVPTNVSVEEFSTAQISVYPNPANSVLNIDFAQSGSAKAELFNLSGQVVATEALFNGINQINLNGLPEGLYLLRVSAEGESTLETFKILVK